jgi:hypothetical protein
MREVEEWIWKAEAGEVCHWVTFKKKSGIPGIDRYFYLPFKSIQSRMIKCIYCIILYIQGSRVPISLC